ncbi:hypothetical protein Tco_1024790 [Tanacetum coccineum]
MPGETPPQTSKITNDHFRPLQVEDFTHLKKNQQVPKNEGYRSERNLTRRSYGESYDEQQVLRPPPNRPSQDNQGQGDGPQYIQITPTITAFSEQMKEERRLDSSHVNILMVHRLGQEQHLRLEGPQGQAPLQLPANAKLHRQLYLPTTTKESMDDKRPVFGRTRLQAIENMGRMLRIGTRIH